MKCFSPAALTVLLLCAFAYAFPPAAHAYIDPGAGSIMMQIIFGGWLALAFAVGRFRDKLFAVFSKRPGKVAKENSSDS